MKHRTPLHLALLPLAIAAAFPALADAPGTYVLER